MRKLGVFIWPALMVAAGATNAAGQQGWFPPTCELNTGHFLLNSAAIYIRTASASRFQDQRERHLRDARRVLHDAIERGQGDNPATWYFLGRYYLLIDDLVGADSAFEKAERLKPDCGADIRDHRRRTWQPILNRGVRSLQANDNRIALEAFREAHIIYRQEPPGFQYMALIFARSGQEDSAIVYYKRAVELAEGSDQYRDMHRTAALNLARLYHGNQERDSATVWYKKFREIDPEYVDGMVGLAEVYTRAAEDHESNGEAEAAKEARQSALALYDTVLARSENVDAVDLFSTGVSLFQEERYESAALAFELGLEKNPYYRDGLFNLANTYLSIGREMPEDATEEEETEIERGAGEKLLPIALRLLEVDPYNLGSRRLLAAAYQLLHQPDSVLQVLEGIEAMPFEISVLVFEKTRAGYLVGGSITNLKQEGQMLPEILFELLDTEGNVLHTESLGGTTLEADGYTEFSFASQVEGIEVWRYTVAESS